LIYKRRNIYSGATIRVTN